MRGREERVDIQISEGTADDGNAPRGNKAV